MIKLTPTSLGLSPLSSASLERGGKESFYVSNLNPSFRRRRREGGRAKQRPGESSLVTVLVRLYILYK
jgi:hypothetical protein